MATSEGSVPQVVGDFGGPTIRGVGFSGRKQPNGREHQSHCSCKNEVERLRATLEKGEQSWGQVYAMLVAERAANERLRAAVLAYDDLIRVAAQRGQRVVDDDPHLDELYEAMIRAAGRIFDGWQP